MISHRIGAHTDAHESIFECMKLVETYKTALEEIVRIGQNGLRGTLSDYYSGYSNMLEKAKDTLNETKVV